MGAFPERDPWRLIQLAMCSRAALCMLPLQDVLGLGNEARMNRPGEKLGNWSWRLEPGQLTDELARRLYDSTEASRRSPLATVRRPPVW